MSGRGGDAGDTGARLHLPWNFQRRLIDFDFLIASYFHIASLKNVEDKHRSGARHLGTASPEATFRKTSSRVVTEIP